MRADAQRNRDRLTEAAQAVFSEHGAGASLDEVAKRAGVGPGTLYRHFPTREALQEAVYRDAVERLCAAGDELRDHTDARQALAEWMRLLLEHMIARRGLAEALVNALGKQGEIFVVSHRALHEVGGDLVDRAKRAGVARPDLDQRDLLWMIHGISQAGVGPDGTARAQRLLTIMTAGSLPINENAERWHHRADPDQMIGHKESSTVAERRSPRSGNRVSVWTFAGGVIPGTPGNVIVAVFTS